MGRVEHIMGMPIGIDVRDPHLDPSALDRAFDWFRSVDATFSTYTAGSQISRLNRGELTLSEAHEDVRAILSDRTVRSTPDFPKLPLPGRQTTERGGRSGR